MGGVKIHSNGGPQVGFVTFSSVTVFFRLGYPEHANPSEGTTFVTLSILPGGGVKIHFDLGGS